MATRATAPTVVVTSPVPVTTPFTAQSSSGVSFPWLNWFENLRRQVNGIPLTGGSGPAGPQGPAGPIGPIGPPGATGATGPAGPTGATGAQGATGPAGAQGLTGPTGATGPAGATGATGSQGPAGAAGATGAVGPTGPQGAMGPQGPAGTGIDLLGSVATESALPSTGNNVGDAWITTDTGHIWTWDGTKWVDGGKIVGPPGPTGPQGPAGATGATGAAGPQGLQGVAGPTGATGAQGLTGATGPAGATGAQGPIGQTGATGSQGPTGLTGATGAAGPTGAQGPTGPAGPSAVSANAGNLAVLGTDQLIFVPQYTAGTGISITGSAIANTAPNVQSDWNASTGLAVLLNKPPITYNGTAVTVGAPTITSGLTLTGITSAPALGTDGTGKIIAVAPSSSIPINNLQNATGTGNLSNANWTQQWKWNLTGTSAQGLYLVDGAGSATGFLLGLQGNSVNVIPLDIEVTPNSSAVHIGSGPGVGGWLTSPTSNPNGLILTGGGQLLNGSWTARATTAASIWINPSGVGQIQFYSSPGLTAGSTYTPAQIAALSSATNATALNITSPTAATAPTAALVGSANSATLAGGASYNSAGSWVAATATPAQVAVGFGQIFFYADTGKTVGSTYTPTQIASLGPSGGYTQLQFFGPSGSAAGIILAGANLVDFVFGAHFNGSWIPDATGFADVRVDSGSIQLLSNTGLTVGTAFTPTQIAVITPISSSLVCMNLSPGGNADGGFLVGNGNFNASGGMYLNTASQWIASRATAGLVAAGTSYGGATAFYCNTSLTVGAVVSPIQIATLGVSGGNSALHMYPSSGGSYPLGAFYGTPNASALTGGAFLSAGSWAASYTGASIISLVGGQVVFYSNTGLTVGALYTPTQVASLNTAGLLTVNGISSNNSISINASYGLQLFASDATMSASLYALTGYSARFVMQGSGGTFMVQGGSWFGCCSSGGLLALSPDTSRYLQMNCANGGNPTLYSSTGVLNSNCAITVTSDYRVKKNVEALNAALPLILKLRPISFDYIDSFISDHKRHIGFLAHELQEVLPGSVSGEKDARGDDGEPQLQGMQVHDLVAVLTRAVQELAAKVAMLEGAWPKAA